MIETLYPRHDFAHGVYTVEFLDEHIDWKNTYVMDDYGTLVCIQYGH